MLCFRDHWSAWSASLEQHRSMLHRDHATLGEWFICAITDYFGRPGTYFMVWLGIWDAAGDGEVIFWRWDFWNAKMKHELAGWVD
jgi:hypothetical protein